MLPDFLSNNCGSTEGQPPRSAIVHSLAGAGNWSRTPAATAGSTGRNPAAAHTFWASAVYWKFLNATAAFRWGLLVTTATGFSILIVCEGLMWVIGFPRRSVAIASFS